MRLKAQDLQSIIQALDPHMTAQEATLYLFGSRTNDQQKGGDIDLLLLTPNPSLKTRLHSKKYVSLSDIKKRIGEQKIDLRISTPTEAESDPFLKTILPAIKRLHH